ncbi:MAG: hypothetical protein M1275_01940 [Patescibacteria group bacterium]|nr:hypothetical protein [Patescibacteria group bacterium]
MRKGLAIVIVLACSVVAAFLIYFSYGDIGQETGMPRQVQYTPAAMSEYPSLASELAQKTNEISPTRSFDDIGWIALRISFVPNDALAYIEYTDTHVTLRLLVQYGRENETLLTTVLATFIPQESGGWELQYGRDVASRASVYNYRFNGDAKQWMPEASNI